MLRVLAASGTGAGLCNAVATAVHRGEVSDSEGGHAWITGGTAEITGAGGTNERWRAWEYFALHLEKGEDGTLGYGYAPARAPTTGGVS